ncbi:signal transduction histidine kinase [Actinoplanes octamycinicus]|uniref:histidine kinase n=1 Tax=Actinoplanes octamycinicus TaxID=135948 RepID=A0A7W7GVZ1_9ACTN|nr:ATP-binding protein [Actinoplanes octamycinicus]MBB4739348.1 signal transduction histidine kinase [Actinoplanes octamycinicus]GIE58676.1 sensor protein CutS [Actinoplanes octamycinicus]
MSLTVRARLTLVYGGLFVLAGLVLLGVTYVLVGRDAMVAGERRAEMVIGPDGQPAALNTIVKDVRADALHALLTQGAIALVLVSAATIALGWLIAGRMLQPLHQITATARRIAESPAADRGLHERIALRGADDEVKRLADTFDVMLARLDHSFDGQRRFIASASHELRTPLTLNRTLLEVALEPESASPEVRQLGATLLAINDRHSRLIDGLLLLARSDREVTERSYVDLADIVDHVAVADTVKVVAEPREAAVLGDPVLLERLVQNLVENGVRHNVPQNGWVRVVTLTRPDGWVELRVANSGPVIPRYEVPGLFEPFHRYRSERLVSPGAGLGLSIVRAVARAHGGDVRADARDDGGLEVTVLLPRAP